MRISQERLIFLALVAVKEAVQACHDAPIRPSRALRSALSFLYAHSKGPRFPYDDFWHAIQDPGLPDKHESARAYARFSNAGSGLKGIIRSVGMPETPDFYHLLSAQGGAKETRQCRFD